MGRLHGRAARRLGRFAAVELTWLIGQFCLLNRWFTALQVPDESAEDEANFLGVYASDVPEDIRQRNDTLLRGEF